MPAAIAIRTAASTTHLHGSQSSQPPSIYSNVNRTPRRASVRRDHLSVLVLATLLSFSGGLRAEPATLEAIEDPSDLSLEQLVNIRVVSVSKKEQTLSDAPAAISVITGEDIRRMGFTSLPEMLRMVPGMDVAQINSHEWAISARGFNNQFANKLLVMVDGRSVYGTGFGGVVWGVQDLMMQDLDRIEVVRGPGATLWGANAMNGVINIISKSSKDTQGLLVTAAGGTQEQPLAAVRYGGQLYTNLYYRVYAKGYNRDGLVLSNGQDAPDSAREIQGGARMDWEPSEDSKLTLQGDYYQDRFVENQDMPSLTFPFTQNFNEVNHNSGGNVLSRWSLDLSDRSSLLLQAYYDHFRNEQAQAAQICDTVDLYGQHRFGLGTWNDIVWGLGYRYTANNFLPSFFVSWDPAQTHDNLVNSFIQDEITLVPDLLKVTVGTKLEHNDYTGVEVEPGARLLWMPTKNQTVWAAIARAVRTPSLSDLNGHVNLQVFPPAGPFPPTLISSFGNPNLEPEELIAYEVGYRIEPVRQCAIDITAFYNDYDQLILPVPGTPSFQPTPTPHTLVGSTNGNSGAAQTYGVELAVQWSVTDNWRLMASYSWFELRSRQSSSPLLSASPQHQAQLRSVLNLPWNLEFNGAVYYVDSIEAPAGLGQMTIPSYVRLDLGLVWRPIKSVELGVWGQNLIDDRHPEFTSYKTALVTEIPRSILGTVTMRF